MIDAIQGAAENDETLALINPAEWDGFALELAENAPEILGAAIQVLKTQAQRNKFAIMVAAAATVGAWSGVQPAVEVAHKFVFGDGLFGGPADDSDEGEDDASPTERPETSSTGSSCDPSAEVNENSVCAAQGREDPCFGVGGLADTPEASL